VLYGATPRFASYAHTAHISLSSSEATPHPAYIPQEVAGTSRRHPRIPQAGWRNVTSWRKSPPTPAQPGSAMTGLSRRRSRVRVPSLPFGRPPARRATDAAAARELQREIGPTLPLTPLLDTSASDVALYVAQARPDAEVVLDDEHDRFLWLPLERRSTPFTRHSRTRTWMTSKGSCCSRSCCCGGATKTHEAAIEAASHVTPCPPNRPSP
jgi:hypothetical protein